MRVTRKMKLFETLVMGGALLFAQGEFVSAQDDEKELTPLQRADADSDGDVTYVELKAYLKENHFEEWKEKIGESATNELFEERYVDRWVEKIDANANGSISKWELRLASKALDQVIVDVAKTKETDAKAGQRKMPTSAIEMMDENFRMQNPVVGTTVEDLVVLNESGEEVDFKSLRGKHVVIVFGCLT